VYKVRRYLWNISNFKKHRIITNHRHSIIWYPWEIRIRICQPTGSKLPFAKLLCHLRRKARKVQLLVIIKPWRIQKDGRGTPEYFARSEWHGEVKRMFEKCDGNLWYGWFVDCWWKTKNKKISQISKLIMLLLVALELASSRALFHDVVFCPKTTGGLCFGKYLNLKLRPLPTGGEKRNSAQLYGTEKGTFYRTN